VHCRRQRRRCGRCFLESAPFRRRDPAVSDKASAIAAQGAAAPSKRKTVHGATISIRRQPFLPQGNVAALQGVRGNEFPRETISLDFVSAVS